MTEKKKCRACGVDVPSNAPFGHCPKCLLELGFGAMPKDALESAADSALRTPNSAPETVRYFGDYELLEQIGRGGMGIVYKARQLSLNRIVALKMISAGEFASPSAVQRFQIEAEAAAKLGHPNIVPIYEIGVHRGQHYFSMKFVEGRSLAEEIRYGKFHFSTGENPPSKAAERERQSAIARLMQTVAHAVHYAHQRGVLHRDLKPGNILVDAEGQPYLTDFGLAKILEHELGVSGSTSVLGTPSYMSPEQAAGRPLMTATDVYSLGAILYELLTGRPPFSGATPMEIFQQLAQQEPAHPQSLNPALDRDLATICLKCLEKDPAKRYPSAEALAEELIRFVANEPILARSVSRRERVWRWCKRKPALAGLGATVVIVTLLGLLGTSWLAVRAMLAERFARSEWSKNEQVKTFLAEMLKGVGPSVALGRDTAMLREILDKTAERAGRDLKEQPEVEADLRLTLGGIYSELGFYKRAEEMYRESLRLYKSRLGTEHQSVARSLNGLGIALRQLGDLKQAEAVLREALAMQRKLLGNEHLDTADSRNNLAAVLQARGDLAGAEMMYREALAIRRKLLGNDHKDVAGLLVNLANLLRERADLAAAETVQREALAMQRKLLSNEHPDVALSLANLAVVLQARGDLAGAEAMQRDALDMRRKLLGNEHPDVALSLNNLAALLYLRGNLAEAEAMHREALAMQRKLLGNDHMDVARSLHNLANVLRARGDLAGAEAMYREALDMKRKLLGNKHPDVAASLDSLSIVLQGRGDLVGAEAMRREALGKRRELLGNEHPDVAGSLNNLASLLHARGDLAGAEAMLQEALAIRRKMLGNEHGDVAESLRNLGGVLYERRNLGAAEPVLQESLAMTRKLRGNEHPDTADLLNMLGVIMEKRDLAGAEGMFRESLAIRRKSLGNEHLSVAESLFNLATALWKQDKLAEAETNYQEALTIDRKHWSNNPSHLAILAQRLTALAGVLQVQSKFVEAEPLLLEGNTLAQGSDQISDEKKREAMKALSDFYMAWAVAAPGGGKIQKSMEWGRELAEFDKALKEKSSVGQTLQVQTLRAQQSESYRVGQYFTETATAYRRAADQGDADAQFNLGACYANGLGVAQDFAEAAKWFGRAAEQNHASAQKHLAFYYAKGRGVMKDEVEAEKWFRRSAEQNDLEAQRVLGLRYANGQGVPKNLTEAVKWLSKAAEQNDAAAQFSLGLCYANGEGVGKNDLEAASWFLKAAKQNHSAAQHGLGFCYATGLGVTKDYAEAVHWYRKAADQNYAASQVNLGICYADGLGVAKDDVEAVNWYRKAAEQNDALAQVLLGRCYAKGLGVAKEEAEALKWYRRAAEANDVGGQNGLAWLLATSNDPAIRDGSTAVVYAEKAVVATGRKNPANLDTLAAAYAESGQFEKAVSTQREAIALLKTEEETKDYTSRLKLYEAKEPYRAKN